MAVAATIVVVVGSQTVILFPSLQTAQTRSIKARLLV